MCTNGQRYLTTRDVLLLMIPNQLQFKNHLLAFPLNFDKRRHLILKQVAPQWFAVNDIRGFGILRSNRNLLIAGKND